MRHAIEIADLPIGVLKLLFFIEMQVYTRLIVIRFQPACHDY